MDCVKEEECLGNPRTKPETGHSSDIGKSSNTQGASEKGTENITTAQRIGPLEAVFISGNGINMAVAFFGHDYFFLCIQKALAIHF